MSTPTTALPTTSSTRPRRRLRALSAAAVVGLALTLCTTTAPAQAAELVPQPEDAPDLRRAVGLGAHGEVEHELAVEATPLGEP